MIKQEKTKYFDKLFNHTDFKGNSFFSQHISPTKALFFVPKIKTYMPLKTINRFKLEKLTSSMKSKKSVAFILCRMSSI